MCIKNATLQLVILHRQNTHVASMSSTGQGAVIRVGADRRYFTVVKLAGEVSLCIHTTVREEVTSCYQGRSPGVVCPGSHFLTYIIVPESLILTCMTWTAGAAGLMMEPAHTLIESRGLCQKKEEKRQVCNSFFRANFTRFQTAEVLNRVKLTKRPLISLVDPLHSQRAPTIRTKYRNHHSTCTLLNTQATDVTSTFSESV